MITDTPSTSKRGSAKISEYVSDAHNQQPSKKQILGVIGGSDTDELDRHIAEDHNQMEELRQSRTLAIQLRVKMPDTSMLKRKGLDNMDCNQKNSKESTCRVEESQPTVISVQSVNVKEMIAKKKREALERISKKRQATEDQMLIEQEKKRYKQRAEAHSPELKKQRMSEETNVQAQEGFSKRQKTEGQSGCEQLACSTHKGI